MTPEEAYEEALRRVREAEATETSALNLSSLDALRHLPQDLERLTGLRVLDLSECRQLSGDLSPLAGLTSLQTLDLYGCRQLSGDLSPLAGLTSLQTLDLSGCTGVGKFAPLEPILPQLQNLFLYDSRFDDLPTEICGKNIYENVIHEVRAHLADLQSGQFYDAELKLFILGNGGAGKTQLSRRLRNLHYDPQVPTPTESNSTYCRPPSILRISKAGCASTCGTSAARIF